MAGRLHSRKKKALFRATVCFLFFLLSLEAFLSVEPTRAEQDLVVN